ncbi:MAG: UDP-N-acetylmuramoyl-L-alanine--D-glutamate ligase [Candidatus Sungbacteria bacterium]|uniref:UDP-N-acetylmuramoylalanine--D-glutamate ligase n=1 Tax=Candidatus Sungiibacteriota bacterium TaxID=2750080 RepID=A0A9D6LR89_9BACT|nr:UDP-N-acetylmuramoyl-L-alanine--D-glutamate ligase [Candidatus Sungbacteria bacterium]
MDFKGKKITQMGLGLLGRGVGDAKFLAQSGAELVVTDLKSAADLAPSLEALKGLPNISFVLGRHRLEDFSHRDFILKSANVPLDSPFIAEARRQGIPIEMSTSLFARLTKATIIGVTGTRGKSTTTHLIYEILRQAYRDRPEKIYLGGNIRGVATLPLLAKANLGDIAVLELDSWQLQGFGESGISPHIAVFTTFLDDHLNYYKDNRSLYLDDKANIFKYQIARDVLILNPAVASLIKEKYPAIESQMIIPEALPPSWRLSIPGNHNRENAALALAAVRLCDISEAEARNIIESFPGIPGRLQYLGEKNSLRFYNDTTATTPDATMAALTALASHKKIILIMGGADKMLPMSRLLQVIPRYCKAVLVLPGTGTDIIRHDLDRLQNADLRIGHVSSMAEAVNMAMKSADTGDTILLSPGFASFGLFKNEFDRGDQFVASYQNLP